MTKTSNLHDPKFWATADALKKVGDLKLCLANSSADACEGPIINAHTIPRSQLQRIAINSHVYAFKGNLPTLAKNEGKLEIGKFGTSQFSVLKCFCAKHDREIFLCVENAALEGTDVQVATLNYRGVASEVYRKMRSLATFEHASMIDERVVENAFKQEIVDAFLHGSKLGLLDIGRTFSDCERSIFSVSHDDVSSLIIQFQRPPGVMSVGGFGPEYDFNGRMVQVLGIDETKYQHATISLLANDEGAFFVLAWLKKETAALRLAQSLILQDPKRYTTLILQLVFEYIENTCMNIPWWDGLKEVERNVLTRRMQDAVSTSNRSNSLTYGGMTFDDWGYKSHKFSNI
ncbi:hypothetical protein [Bradyrhizobium australiense]|uniref:Uncharacterized protein n=1 Tax=Bradyrhizobium australiense TaxID=2721161 RepID=A0A7Y4GNX5_9BRAD|nr:hypothetical protein [Bradyrhizobium australiense]NOJ39079.1 hypothetical protein [Bradyrhizobium australiense]